MSTHINSRLSFSALTIAGLIAGGSAHALEAEISGHINRGVMVYDDGDNSQTAFVDNETSNTRARFTGSGQLMPGIEAGIVLEWEFVSNNSSRVTIDDTNPEGTSGSDFDINERHFDVYFQSAFGKLSLGQGDGAANGVTEVDLSGTAIAHYTGAADIGGAIFFQDDGVLSDFTIGDSYDQFDFESRFDRVRYDTPAFGPLGFAVATGTAAGDDIVDTAVTLNTEIVGIGKLAGALGYSTRAGTQETFGGSASLLHDSGLNVTLMYTRRDFDAAPDADSFYAKLGYLAGMHAVSVDYGLTQDLAADGADGDFYGVGYVFKPIDWAELYASAKVHSLDLDGGPNVDNITIAMAGTRLKF